MDKDKKVLETAPKKSGSSVTIQSLMRGKISIKVSTQKPKYANLSPKKKITVVNPNMDKLKAHEKEGLIRIIK